MSEDPIVRAFSALGLGMPKSEATCIYRTGLVDSFGLIQIILELEMETGVRLDLATLMQEEITLAALRQAMADAS